MDITAYIRPAPEARHPAVDIRAQARERAASMREMAVRVLVPPLARRLDARRIWLFGSVARGVPSQDSDLDVLVEVGENAAGLPFKERVAAAYDVIAEAPLAFGCDIIPWTSAELIAKHQTGGPFFRTLWGERELLYERRR